jgi:coenzyme F420-0:L-glutamate ligase/coenzyme F420-1:gamma-L-glutamate ligase
VVIANAGVDQSNTPINTAILWPKDPSNTAQSLKNALILRFGKQIGVILVDSQCFPLRRGTRGFTLAIAGLEGIIDERGKKDLFGKKMRITTVNIADQLAAAASSVMGERGQKVPVVIIRNAPIKLSKKNVNILNKELLMSSEACLFKDYGLR